MICIEKWPFIFAILGKGLRSEEGLKAHAASKSSCGTALARWVGWREEDLARSARNQAAAQDLGVVELLEDSDEEVRDDTETIELLDDTEDEEEGGGDPDRAEVIELLESSGDEDTAAAPSVNVSRNDGSSAVRECFTE